MISLTDELETTIDINGEEVPIDLSYDNVLRYFELIDDQSFDNAEKVMMAMIYLLVRTIKQTPT